ncbi:nitroreductase family protein [Pontibacillus salipaludis]|uniref:NAD(P)H nitroreductase YodC n=1 Tax=Pontibacillus salipaludis TaxID=1697394 RepID=A0ABQ1Q9I7_9BACI|nr:nitroreductase family protein [Pontibacillus salipaludis]GGD19943.1 putative NAD(P)H nitroreductase YodC [Pontibacillus salipaludis]
MDTTMIETMQKRNGTKEFAKDSTISKEELEAILKDATTAPSSFNLQHWHFLVFHSNEAKQQLLPIAFGQEKVTDAAATIAVLADKEANANIDDAFNPLVENEVITTEMKENIAGTINRIYENKQAAHDTALINAGLVSMQIMLAAEARDYDTLAMGGFSANQLKETFDISERFEPVMLISIGKEAWTPAKTPRRSVEEVSTWI